MRPPIFKISTPVARALLCLTLLAGGCTSSPPEPVEFTDEELIEATVEMVDAANRTLTLRGPGGDSVTLQVPEARNLAQVAPGDLLRVSYFATYRASLAEPGTADSGVAMTAGRAAEGDRPGAFIGAEAATVIEIVSVAEDGSSVSFRSETGQLDSMNVEREEGREFARGLKRGDMVLLEYAEAVAIDIEASAGTN
jgi:hypothetical protein